MVKITVSEKRNSTPQKIEIGENTLTTWGTIKVNKSHFFPSSFQIKSGNKVIYIDPVEVGTSEAADFILITHSHPDHCSIKDIQKVIKSETTIICSKGVSKKLKDFNNAFHIMRPGDTLELDGMSCEATAAYNTKSVLLWIKAHPKSKENVGFIVKLPDGIRIYHAGDTDYISEIKGMADIQLALIPIGGDNLTMNEEDAAHIINRIKPEKVIPMHYEIKNREELNRFKTLVDNSIKIIELE